MVINMNITPEPQTLDLNPNLNMHSPRLKGKIEEKYKYEKQEPRKIGMRRENLCKVLRVLTRF